MKQLLLTLAVTATLISSAAQPPNIVMILCDDLGYGEVHCLNPERSAELTPHIDKMASDGMVFTDAHSGSSVCTPTRYGLLTGRYSWRTRLQQGVVGGAGKSHAPLIKKEILTVPELLRNAGYSTAMFGKWHLGFRYLDENGNEAKPQEAPKWTSGLALGTKVGASPVEYGFDHYTGFHHSAQIETLIENDRVVRELPKEQILGFLGDRACEYIAEQAKADAPFFVYLPLNSPHGPIAPSAEWIGKSGLGAYCDFVMETDHVVGRVLEALKTNGVDEDTLVIFSSDNGCSRGTARAWELEGKYSHYPSANLRGYKSDLWDGGHRVPFIVRWPGRVKAGTSSPKLLCLTDLMATCAELTGQALSENEGVDSVSFLPMLSNPDAVSRDSAIHHSLDGYFAIRQGKWKLLVSPGSGGWSKPKNKDAIKEGLPAMQLYDMEADIGESRNLIAEFPEKAAELFKELEQQVEKGRTTPGPDQKNDVPVDIEK